MAKDVYADLGTRIRGRLAYFAPTAFFQLGEHGPRGRFIRPAAAKFKGDIFLDDPAAPGPVHIANGAYDLKVAASVFLEARYRPWGVSISVAGPPCDDDAYQYNLSDIAYISGIHIFSSSLPSERPGCRCGAVSFDPHPDRTFLTSRN